MYCSEIFPTHIRSKGVGWSLAVLFLSALVYLEAAPTAFANIGWKYYLLFIILTAINIAVIWWLFPETKGLSLEEINEMFGDEVVVHITHISDEEKRKLDAQIAMDKTGEAEKMETVDQERPREQ